MKCLFIRGPYDGRMVDADPKIPFMYVESRIPVESIDFTKAPETHDMYTKQWRYEAIPIHGETLRLQVFVFMHEAGNNRADYALRSLVDSYKGLER